MKDAFDILYGKFMGSSRDRAGDLFLVNGKTFARRETWSMHARLDDIVFLALGTRWSLAIDEDQDASVTFDVGRQGKRLLHTEMWDLRPGWAKTSLDEFLLSHWSPPQGTTTPSGIPWEIGMILDPEAQAAAVAAYLSSRP